MLIAFSGKMRSGKDAAANYIEDRMTRLGYTVTRMAFADTLKRIASYAQHKAGLPPFKDRELLQFIGVHFRKHNANVWVDALTTRVKDDLEAGESDVILVTDLRFENEYEALRDMGFVLVRTHASPEIRIGRGAEPHALEHISETALDAKDDEFGSWNMFIKNEDSLEAMHGKLDRVINYCLDYEWGSF